MYTAVSDFNPCFPGNAQILDVPIPGDCYPSNHADYAGDGVVWGLGHKKASAADCCRFSEGFEVYLLGFAEPRDTNGQPDCITRLT